MLVAFCKEVEIYFSNQRWNLIDATSFSLMIVGGILIFCFLLFQIVLTCVKIIWINRYWQLNAFVADLNPNRFFISLFYFHFYILRILLSILLCIDDMANSKILWIVFTCFQFFATCLHLLKLFETCFLSIISFFS